MKSPSYIYAKLQYVFKCKQQDFEQEFLDLQQLRASKQQYNHFVKLHKTNSRNQRDFGGRCEDNYRSNKF